MITKITAKPNILNHIYSVNISNTKVTSNLGVSKSGSSSYSVFKSFSIDLTKTIQDLGNTLSSIGNNAGEILKGAVQTIGSLTDQAISAIDSGCKNLASGLQNEWSQLTTSVQNAIQIDPNKISAVVNLATGGALGAAMDALKDIPSIWHGITTGNLSEIATNLVDVAASPFTEIVSGSVNLLSAIDPNDQAAFAAAGQEINNDIKKYGPEVFDVVTGLPVAETLNAMEAVGSVQNLSKPEGMFALAVSAVGFILPGDAAQYDSGLALLSGSAEQQVGKHIAGKVISNALSQAGIQIDQGAIDDFLNGNYADAAKLELEKMVTNNLVQQAGLPNSFISDLNSGDLTKIAKDGALAVASKNGIPSNIVDDAFNNNWQQLTKDSLLAAASKNGISSDVVSSVMNGNWSNAAQLVLHDVAQKNGIDLNALSTAFNGLSLSDQFKNNLQTTLQSKGLTSSQINEVMVGNLTGFAKDYIATHQGQLAATISNGNYQAAGEDILNGIISSNSTLSQNISNLIQFSRVADNVYDRLNTSLVASKTTINSEINSLANRDLKTYVQNYLVDKNISTMPSDSINAIINGQWQNAANIMLNKENLSQYINPSSNQIVDELASYGISTNLAASFVNKDAQDMINFIASSQQTLPSSLISDLANADFSSAVHDVLINTNYTASIIPSTALILF